MDQLIQVILQASYWGIFLVIFIETALLVGFFLPGDSLLIMAGIIAATGQLNLGGVMLAIVAGAILGYLGGYWLGYRFGPSVFNKQQSRFFKPEYVDQAHQFFERYGAQSVILARFVPIVRTVVPTLAGVSRMNLVLYNVYNVIGAVLWGVGLPAVAYYFGKKIPNLDHYVLLIVGVVLVISVIPVLWKLLRRKKSRGMEG